MADFQRVVWLHRVIIAAINSLFDGLMAEYFSVGMAADEIDTELKNIGLTVNAMRKAGKLDTKSDQQYQTRLCDLTRLSEQHKLMTICTEHGNQLVAYEKKYGIAAGNAYVVIRGVKKEARDLTKTDNVCVVGGQTVNQSVQRSLDAKKILRLRNMIMLHIVRQVPACVHLILQQIVKICLKGEIITSSSIVVAVVEKLYALGACRMVLNAIAHYQTHGDILAQGLRLIAVLSLKLDLAKRQLTDLGGCELVVEMMKQWRANYEIQCQGLLAITGLSLKYDVAISCFIESGVCGIVVDSLKQHGKDTDILKTGFWLMARLCSNKKGKKDLTKIGGCGLVVDAIKLHNEHATIQHFGLRAIAAIVCNNSKAKEEFIDHGGCRQVLNSLKQHVQQSNIHKNGLVVILNLCSNNRARQELTELGACEIVLNSLKRYIAHKTIQENALWAIVNLSLNNDKASHAFIELDGCDAIVDCLKHHADNTHIQHFGLRAIVNVSWNHDRAKQKFVKLGGFGLIMDSLKRHPGHAAIQKFGVMAKMSICSNGDKLGCGIGSASTAAFGIMSLEL